MTAPGANGARGLICLSRPANQGGEFARAKMPMPAIREVAGKLPETRRKFAGNLRRADESNWENTAVSAKELDAAKGWATIKVSARRLKL
jgi:hypothetical protein